MLGNMEGGVLKRFTALAVGVFASLILLGQQIGFPVATPFAVLAEELTPAVVSSEVRAGDSCRRRES